MRPSGTEPLFDFMRSPLPQRTWTITGVRETVDHRSVTKGLLVRIALGVFGLLTVAVLVLAVFNDKGVLQVRNQSRKLTAMQDEMVELDAENKQLTKEIQALRTDPTTIENLAREELKLVKPGEIVLVSPEK